MSGRNFFKIFLIVLISVMGCRETSRSEESKIIAKKEMKSNSEVPPVIKKQPSNLEICQDKISKFEEIDEVTLKRLNDYNEVLPYLQVVSRVESNIFFKIPVNVISDEADAVKAQIPDNYRARRVISSIIKKYKNRPEFLRDIFLTDGYLYEIRVHIASAMVKELHLSDLFNDDKIYFYKEGKIIPLHKSDDEYLDENNEKVKLLIGSRVSDKKETLLVPLHLDAELIANSTGAKRVIPVKIYNGGAEVKLIFPDDSEVNVFIYNKGLTTQVLCELNSVEHLAEYKTNSDRYWKWVEQLNSAAILMVLDKPDFDEPENEPDSEQEDGKLRIEWEKSYRQGKKKFIYRELEYDVFNRHGNPVPPEVCIDFIFDTWQRASGNWYKSKKMHPGRTEGFLDFDEIEHLNTRHTPSILQYAKKESLPFERYDFSHKSRVPFKKTKKFSKALAGNSNYIREGDILVIHGLREEDMKEHFHTVLVLDTYPVTGIPSVVADNAGKPRIRNIASAMRSAPRRMIKYRIRLNWNWLTQKMKAE